MDPPLRKHFPKPMRLVSQNRWQVPDPRRPESHARRFPLPPRPPGPTHRAPLDRPATVACPLDRATSAPHLGRVTAMRPPTSGHSHPPMGGDGMDDKDDDLPNSTPCACGLWRIPSNIVHIDPRHRHPDLGQARARRAPRHEAPPALASGLSTTCMGWLSLYLARARDVRHVRDLVRRSTAGAATGWVCPTWKSV